MWVRPRKRTPRIQGLKVKESTPRIQGLKDNVKEALQRVSVQQEVQVYESSSDFLSHSSPHQSNSLKILSPLIFYNPEREKLNDCLKLRLVYNQNSRWVYSSRPYQSITSFVWIRRLYSNKRGHAYNIQILKVLYFENWVHPYFSLESHHLISISFNKD